MTDSYDAFIEMAYVDPIRSVLIVDDDYPTYDDILAGAGSDERTEKKWHEAPDRVRELLRQFRNRETPLLVDIHDGQNVPEEGAREIARHLHQSDLLVLDYELDRTRHEDGSLAIDILRRISENSHFNLVVIYTSVPLDKVFQQVRLGLLSASQDLAGAVDEGAAVQRVLDDAEGERQGLEDELLASIGEEAYLEYRRQPSQVLRKMESAEQPFSGFRALCAQADLGERDRRRLLLYALYMRESRLAEDLSSKYLGAYSWAAGEPYWIQSGSIFVAFAQKGEHDQLLPRLTETLSGWDPTPSRLFLSRLRADIDEQGVAVQEHVLDRCRALAFWYSRLLDAESDTRLQHITESVKGHAELLLDEVLPSLSEFAEELIHFEKASGENTTQICNRRFNVDLTDRVEKRKALIEHNVLVCSRPPAGRHLTTGHVFQEDEDYWVCLTPACDLVPGQGAAARRERFGEWLPFIAVQLHRDVRAAPKEGEINEGRCLFFTFDGKENQTFLFTSQRNAQPVLTFSYAKDRGLFTIDRAGKQTFTIGRTITTNGGLGVSEKVVHVVGQLRYEYALNLLHKLGGSLSRVGLDFVGRID